MQDSIRLVIGKKEIEDFISYKIESNLFVADDAFSLELANPEAEIKEGQQCEIYVNDKRELTGLIDKISEHYDKQGRKLTIEGRDLLGLLVDSYCEEFTTKQNIELKELTKQLLQKVPFIKRKDIKYGKGNKERAVPLNHKKEEFEFIQIKPGQTIFDVLREHAMARGMLFYNLPDGTLMFGEPLTSGKAEYALICAKNSKNNNIIEGNKIRNISKRHSKIVVIGQIQGIEGIAPENVNKQGTIEDKTFPFYKPFVAEAKEDGQLPQKYAKVIMEKQRFEGFHLSYKTYGHSQNNKNYQVNSICHVKDEIFGVDKDYLVYARTFEMSKQAVWTTLKLSELGVLPL